jgi:hypothetical protein
MTISAATAESVSQIRVSPYDKFKMALKSEESRDNIQIFCQNSSISPGGLAYNIRTWTSTKVDIKGEEFMLFLIDF